MRGIRLLVLVLMAIVLGTLGLMFFFSGGDLTSWSVADKTRFRWMLGIVLGATSLIWIIFAFKYAKREEVLLSKWKVPNFSIKKPFINWVNIDIKYRHAFSYNALFFLLILIFGLGGGLFMQIGHYIFTILGAVTTFLIVVRSEKGLNRTINAVWLYGSGLIWILGFFNIVFTIFFGEFIFAVRVIFWVEQQIKYIDNV